MAVRNGRELPPLGSSVAVCLLTVTLFLPSLPLTSAYFRWSCAWLQLFQNHPEMVQRIKYMLSLIWQAAALSEPSRDGAAHISMGPAAVVCKLG